MAKTMPNERVGGAIFSFTKAANPAHITWVLSVLANYVYRFYYLLMFNNYVVVELRKIHNSQCHVSFDK